MDMLQHSSWKHAQYIEGLQARRGVGLKVVIREVCIPDPAIFPGALHRFIDAQEDLILSLVPLYFLRRMQKGNLKGYMINV